MKRFLRVLLKVFGWTLAVLVVLVAIGLACVFLFFPRSIPASPEPIARTPARLARGEYLVNHVAGCLNCHSERDWTLYSAPVKPETRGQGACVMIYGKLNANSANLTPFGIGTWTDGEVVRAVTSGIRKDGTPLHPLMSYDTYAQMSREDVESIVAYLRTLPPVEHALPRSEMSFLLKVLSRVLPKPWEPPPAPDPSNTVAYGRYLVSVAECDLCHRVDFAGGRSFQAPGDETAPPIVSNNITPDPETGIGGWSRDNFIGVFKSFASAESQKIPVPRGKPNTVMPWVQFAGMSEQDLGAIYDFLRTVPPVKKPDAKPTGQPLSRARPTP